ncbi:hypothetical protein M413DRAFT_446700 [Hebeloma cylindrosporum]|uniref:XLF-like N-terminal domain-containing protein n=1 Tax=Hebeloma cylindrosporum TaxID=76867 RepID=A0A0C2XQ81_HEBCY|nr:hypothetical protein M413DRAFT_446700 [Hebeloma cylindrosporum h7]
MEQFTEEHAKLLISKEWLAKVDTARGIPYLLKFHFSLADLSCCVLITDTKSVWAEVLTSKLLARRWRVCNSSSPEPFAKTSDEEAWREQTLELLSNVHTIGGISELSFETVTSDYSDLAIELECEIFKWRWETCFLGYQRSSELISKHLIFPLISLNHLAFSSPEGISELSDADVERAIDKVGRTARRTIDTHIKNALAKPRLSTSIRRMSSMFNFVPDLPPVVSIAETPPLHISHVELDEVDGRVPVKSGPEQRNTVPPKPTSDAAAQRHANTEAPTKGHPESATESEDDEPMPDQRQTKLPSPTRLPTEQREVIAPTPSLKAAVSPPTSQTKEPSPDSGSPPQRPTKKAKPAVPSSSDEESEDDRKKRGGSTGVKRGTRQPIKRGGKRF